MPVGVKIGQIALVISFPETIAWMLTAYYVD